MIYVIDQAISQHIIVTHLLSRAREGRRMTLDGHHYRGAISATNSLFVVCVVEISGPPNVNSFAVLIYLLKDCAGDIRTAQIESISGPDNIRRFFSHGSSTFPHKYIPAPASVGWYISKNDRFHFWWPLVAEPRVHYFYEHNQ